MQALHPVSYRPSHPVPATWTVHRCLASALLLLVLGLGQVCLADDRPSTKGASPDRLDSLARVAWLQPGSVGDEAAQTLRVMGPQGLEAFLAAADEAVDAPLAPGHQRLDALCAQHLCAASRLYWYTDLEAALELARAQELPVLSLRLLGRLDEEHSCANSRFFRAALYSDPSIASLMQGRFVLHWESVRAVPRMRVDFGEGRLLELPVGGNSVHYVLDYHGRLVEAFPGLYDPKTFLGNLETARWIAEQSAGKHGVQHQRWLQKHHQRRITALQAQLQRHQRRVRELDQAGGAELQLASAAAGQLSSRLELGGRAMYKAIVEVPLLETVAPVVRDHPWPELLPLYLKAARLAPESRRLVRQQLGSLTVEQDQTAVQHFERGMALDTILNRYSLEPEVCRHLAAGPVITATELPAFTDRIYAQVFGTPLDDPWLGLFPSTRYAGLEGAGRLPAP